MYLDLVVDHEAEVAFKRQQDGDDVPRVLRREKALTRDASFVLIFLRREYAFADPDDGPVMITRDQVSEFLRAYREDGDSDDARFSRRVDAAINALIKPWQILEPDPAVDYLFTISPVVVPLVGADEMRRLRGSLPPGRRRSRVIAVTGRRGRRQCPSPATKTPMTTARGTCHEHGPGRAVPHRAGPDPQLGRLRRLAGDAGRAHQHSHPRTFRPRQVHPPGRHGVGDHAEPAGIQPGRPRRQGPQA